MKEARGLFLCQYRNKDYSDTPDMSDMEKVCYISYGENEDTIKRECVVYENGKRGIKFLFIHGSYQYEKTLFVGDTETFYYSYTDITGPSDWDEIDVYIYLKLIEKIN